MALTKIKADGLTADLIDETKLADNSIDSEHYNDGSIDNAHLADDAVGVAELSATGTASSSTFLRGDNSWATPTDTNTVTTVNNNADNRVITGSGTANTLNGESGLTYDSTTLVVSGSGEVKALSHTADNTDKKALFTTGHRDTSEENVSGVVVQGADGDNIVDIGGGQGSYNSATKIRFYTGANATTTTGTERMRINPDGYVGINDTVPSPDSIGGNTVDTCLELGGSMTGADKASVIKLIGRSGSTANKCQIQWCGANNRFDITVNGNQALQIQANKDVEVTDGNLVIGTSGHGIDFSATANASTTGSTMSNELLADYEVGAFTPKILKYSGGNWVDATMTSSTPSGCYYVKIGEIVHFHIGWDFQVSDSNYCAIGGLPFSRNGRGTCVVHYTNAFANTQNQGAHLSGSGTAMQWYKDGNSWNSWNNNSSVYLYCDGVFRAL